jgi:ribosomal protein L11 methylase PrmA
VAPARHPASFRDPSGFLFVRDGTLYRQVDRRFATEFDAFVDSGAYAAMVDEGLLIAHEEVGRELAATEDAYKVLRPAPLSTISYPYEWCPAQRRDAALLTLRIQDVALDHGLTLRDASAYNVQFDRGRAVFIDTLSFAPWTEGEPWIAYRQFCQHFLAPLALEAMVDPRLSELLTTNIDGIPLDLAAGLLPLRSKLRPGLLVHLHGQAKASGKPVEAGEQRRTVRFSARAMRGLVDNLRGTVSKLTWEPQGTWTGYYEEASHYTDAAMQHKLDVVSAWLGDLAPRTVWDLGANTGRFARLAADAGAHVVAWDIDRGAVQRAWESLRDADADVLPLVLDLSNPSPAIGWANDERGALADRGPVDLVLALGLIHHLAIANNVPLDRIADLLADLGEHAIVEWVPKDDPKVGTMLATREDVFDRYTVADFEAAFAARFVTDEVTPVAESGRVLYRFRRA